MDKNSIILITGSGGVLGYGLLQALNEKKYLNILSPNSSELNALDEKSVDDYFTKNKPSYVFHLASLVYGLQGNLDNQLKSLCSNTTINQNIIVACKNHRVKKIFFAGTVASYPYPYKSLPLKEDFFLDGEPHWGEYGYASAKRHALAYLKIMKEYDGIDYCYGLFTNLFGQNDKFDTVNGHVIPSLIEKSISSINNCTNRLNVWGRPDTTRDFLFGYDAGIAAILAMEKYSGVINIASGKESSMQEVTDAINEYFDNKMDIVWDPMHL
ncbi:NAD-dependent epimerase/dehydratase family protein [Yersinia sp. 2545 StPb PI]|uniref:NAD-dependent epimerase/dehydratase family protein n=1 Tax=Yersinia sp. 2545 StPb PI TaxID=3117410 RepID=UPI003FA49745